MLTFSSEKRLVGLDKVEVLLHKTIIKSGALGLKLLLVDDWLNSENIIHSDNEQYKEKRLWK